MAEYPAAYGQRVPASGYRLLRAVVGQISATTAGNVIVRIGREISEGGWEQTEYLVLTPAEARALAAEISAAAGA